MVTKYGDHVSALAWLLYQSLFLMHTIDRGGLRAESVGLLLADGVPTVHIVESTRIEPFSPRIM